MDTGVDLEFISISAPSGSGCTTHLEPESCLVTRHIERLTPATAVPRMRLYGESLGDGILARECGAVAVGGIEDLAA